MSYEDDLAVLRRALGTDNVQVLEAAIDDALVALGLQHHKDGRESVVHELAETVRLQKKPGGCDGL